MQLPPLKTSQINNAIMNFETDAYGACGILRSIQSAKTERKSDESFAMNLGTMALMFVASYHAEEFCKYWHFVTKQQFPSERLSEVASRFAANNQGAKSTTPTAPGDEMDIPNKGA